MISHNPAMAPMANQIRQAFSNPQFREMLSNPDSLRAMLQSGAALRGGMTPEALANMPNLFTAPPAAGQGQNVRTEGQGDNPLSTPPHEVNPFGMVDPNMLQQLLGGYGGLPTALGGAGNANPANTRPPEERFEQQLTQLREMGFVNTTQNVRALVATGGNVQMAIEYILGGGGLL